MKPTSLLLAAALVLTISRAPAADPLAGAFLPPETIMQAREQIGMTPEQMEAFRDRGAQVQPRFQEVRTKLENETVALATLAKQDGASEAAILAQLDKVLDAERELKHLQVGLMMGMQSLLTAEQKAKLREMIKSSEASKSDKSDAPQPEESVRERLTAKIEKIKAAAQKAAEKGYDPSEIGHAMDEKVRPLLQAGKIAEGEAELDRLLEQLEREAK